jgi:hypothetical protein
LDANLIKADDNALIAGIDLGWHVLDRESASNCVLIIVDKTSTLLDVLFTRW